MELKTKHIFGAYPLKNFRPEALKKWVGYLSARGLDRNQLGARVLGAHGQGRSEAGLVQDAYRKEMDEMDGPCKMLEEWGFSWCGIVDL